MQRIARFEKVSEARYAMDGGCAYGAVMLPKRATAGSAGYDFYTPEPICLKPGEAVKVLTGIRCRMDPEWVLAIFPRSGLGFKYRLQLDNTAGIIDSDYYHAENEGHIQIKIRNDSRDGKTLELPAGSAFAQGIFLQYGITEDDETDAARTGGFGSTSK